MLRIEEVDDRLAHYQAWFYYHHPFFLSLLFVDRYTPSLPTTRDKTVVAPKGW